MSASDMRSVQDDARLLAQKIRLRLPASERLHIDGLGPALGAHGGPGTLLVSVSPVVSLDEVASGLD